MTNLPQGAPATPAPSKTLKKEFVTTWSKELVHCESRSQFFDQLPGEAYAFVPDDIKFGDLIGFSGLKTKVTIEVVPW